MTPTRPVSAHGTEPDIGALYDIIMAVIEPDLLRKNLPLLEEKYKGESEAEKEKRLRHYQECLTLFDEAVRDIAEDAALRMVLGDTLTQPLTDPFVLAA